MAAPLQTGRRVIPVRRIPALLLCLALLIPAAPAVFAADYTDAEDHWAQASIQRTSDEMGVVRGSGGEFRPDDIMTRGELAMMLDRIFGYPEAAPAEAFPTLAPDAWYTQAVLGANAVGVLRGDGSALRPEDPVTRQEAAVLLARAYGMETGAGEKALPYTDAASVADWALDAVGVLTARGVLRGDNGALRPEDPVTRAEVVAMLDRMETAASVREPDAEEEIIEVEAPPGVIVTPPVDTVTDPGTGTNPDPASGAGSAETAGTMTAFGRTLPIYANVARNTYDKSCFTKDSNGWIHYDKGSFSAPAGVDVSAWQKEIDWNRVRQAGFDFAIIRVGGRGYGSAGNTYLDSYYRQNIEGAQAAGLDVGVYFFSQAVNPTEAVEEAEILLRAIDGYELQYPVVYDWENVNSSSSRTRNAVLSSIDTTACALAFCRRVEQAGYTPVIYFNSYIGLLCYDVSRLTAYDFWYAGYNSTPGFYYDFRIWQYTSTGKVPGISGSADLNLCLRPY